MNPHQEVKLSETASERDLYDSLAEIYSIIITLDGLEKAYIKDSIPEAEDTEICSRLLKQYRSNLNDETGAREFVDLETFKREWGVRCSPFGLHNIYIVWEWSLRADTRSSGPEQPNAFA